MHVNSSDSGPPLIGKPKQKLFVTTPPFLGWKGKQRTMAACIYNLDVAAWLAFLLGTVNSVQALIATVGNLAVFVIFMKNPRLRTRSNYCLMSLAATDLLVGIVLEPLHVVQFFSSEHRNNCGLNTVRRFLSTLLMGASIGSIAVISYDRYIHLSQTVNYIQYMPKKKVVLLLVLCWLGPLVIPAFRFASEVAYKVFVVLYIIGVLAIMVTCYVFIIKIVKNRGRLLSNSADSGKRNTADIKAHVRAAKAVILIISFFIATFAPLAVYHLVTAISGLVTTKQVMSDVEREVGYAVLMTLGMANSGANPIIYYLRIPEFRSTMKRYIGSFLPNFVTVETNETKSDTKDSRIIEDQI